MRPEFILLRCASLSIGGALIGTTEQREQLAIHLEGNVLFRVEANKYCIYGEAMPNETWTLGCALLCGQAASSSIRRPWSSLLDEKRNLAY